MMLLGPGRASAQAVAPAAAEKAGSSLARYVPGGGVFAYFEFDGLDAHREAWKKTAAQKALNDTQFGALLRDLARQGFEIVRRLNPDLKQADEADLALVFDQITTQGFAGAVFGDPDRPGGVFILRGVGRPEIMRLVERAANAGRPKGAPVPEPIQKAGRRIHPGGEGGWWIEGRDLVFADGRGLDDVLAALDGKGPNAEAHPMRAALARKDDDLEPVARGFLDFSGPKGLPPEAAKLGLDGVKAIEFRWGFQADALTTVVRLVAPAPRRGALRLIEQPTFDVRSLPPIPAGLTGFNALSIDLLKTYDQVLALVKENSPDDVKDFEAFEARVRDRLGLDLRGDVLKLLGPRVAIYLLPVEEPQVNVPDPRIAALFAYGGLVIGAQTPDEPALAANLEKVVKVVNQAVAEQAEGVPNPPRFARQDGPNVEYVMDLSDFGPPGLLGAAFSPTITISKNQLIVAGSRDAARKAAAAAGAGPDGRWKPTEAFIPLAERLPRGMVLLSISDVRESLPAVVENFPQFVPAINAQLSQASRARGGPDIGIEIDPAKVPPADQLRSLLFPASLSIAVDDRGIFLTQRESLPSVTSPTAAGVMVGLLLPAVQSAREAARRAQCVNNLKQIGLACHNYQQAHEAYPGNIVGKDGQPLLSWRVAILPYIEQEDLYNEFKLDEPWDSPHNKPLLDRMPATFACPTEPRPDPTLTHYLGFDGPGGMFENGAKIALASVTDGTSLTIMTVESRTGVPWTKPEDIRPTPDAPPSLQGAGSKHPGGFNAAFVDGSVRFLKTSIDPKVFRALSTRNGGEVIAPDSF
jgi:prepilin-type processing-associated H-X9-DG protein